MSKQQAPSFLTQSFQEPILASFAFAPGHEEHQPTPLGVIPECMYMCLHACVYVYMCICTHTHMYTLDFSGLHRPGQGSRLHLGEGWFRAQKVPVQSTLVTPEGTGQHVLCLRGQISYAWELAARIRF